MMNIVLLISTRIRTRIQTRQAFRPPYHAATKEVSILRGRNQGFDRGHNKSPF